MSEPLPSEANPGVAPPPLSPAALFYLRGRDADARVHALVEERHALRPALGVLARRLVRRRAYEPLGFRSLGDYARERLGLTAQGVREWARVWEALETLPELRAAVLGGGVSWSVARHAVRHASPELDQEFARTLRGRTVRAAQEMLRSAFPETENETAPDTVYVRVRVGLAHAHHARWLAALELARRVAGEALPVWECAEAMAAESLSALPADVVSRAAPAVAEPAPRHRPARSPGVPASREHGLRARAFPVSRWDSTGTGAARLDALEAWTAVAAPHALDAALRRAVRRLQRIDHDLGRILRQVLERGLHRELGFPSFERYVEERVDVSPRTARRWVRFARLGPAGSAVAAAFRSGGITARQASAIAEAVDGRAQGEAVSFAQRVTLARLERELDAAGGGAGPISFLAPPGAANVFRLALAAAELHVGADALPWMIEHCIATWLAHGARFHDYAGFERDGWRCTAPGCTARRGLESHHVIFRSHGGPDEAWNRTTLCAFHHHRGVHARLVRCTGRAPDALVFELGSRAGGLPLLRADGRGGLLR